MFCLLGLVQILQYRYQHGQLYKMKALGEKGSMEVTVGTSGLSITKLLKLILLNN